jgi:hypothetical protein
VDLLSHGCGAGHRACRTTGAGNKTGTWEHITHDVAYVDAPGGTYIIAVLSDTDRDWDQIADVSEAVYSALTET